MAAAPKANAVVGQSGGPTGTINASLAGVIEEVSKRSEIENLYGTIHAVEGIVKEDFIDLKSLSVSVLEGVASCPSAALVRAVISRMRHIAGRFLKYLRNEIFGTFTISVVMIQLMPPI